MRVLLTHSYFLRLDPKQWRTKKPYPPLGTLYALAALRAAGHDVTLFDTMFARGAVDLSVALDEHRPDVLVIYDDGFNYLTKMCLDVMQREALNMVGLAKKRGLKVVVAGSDATDHRDRYLDAGADFVLLGDGEETLVELLDPSLTDHGERSLPVGLIHRDAAHTRDTGRRKSPSPLDTLPRPAWDAVDLSHYRSMWRSSARRFSLNLVSSRGCPYGCNWCAKPLFGRQYLVHSPERMVVEVKAVRNLGAGHIWFCDDIFGLTPEWTTEFGERVSKEQVKTPFTIQTRADLIRKDTLRAGLVKAGLETAWIGAESGSQKILDAMNKGIRVEETREAVSKVKKDGVRVGLFLQFGYLGETKDDIDATLRLIEETMPDEIGVSVSYPLPGTPFHDTVRGLARERGGSLNPDPTSASSAKTNWTDSDDLDLLYPGGFAPAYYKRLHRFTHKFFQSRRGLEALRRLVSEPTRTTWPHLKAAIRSAYYIPAARIDSFRLRRLVS